MGVGKRDLQWACALVCAVRSEDGRGQAGDSCLVPLNAACTEMCSTSHVAGHHSQPAATAICARGAQRRAAPAAARRLCVRALRGGRPNSFLAGVTYSPIER
jgi:hypothetical protein